MTQIAIRDESGIITYQEPEGGWESDGEEDSGPRLPTITMVQPTSRMRDDADKHMGEFWHPDLELYTPELTCVIMWRRNSRAIFEQGSDTALCLSDDGRVPVPDMPLWGKEVVSLKRGDTMVPYDHSPASCRQCPFSAWDGQTPPPCAESYVLLIDRGGDDFVQFRFKGASIKPYREWRDKELSPNRQQPKGAKTYTRKVTFVTERVAGAGQTYYRLKVEACERLPQNLVHHYNNVLAEQRGRFVEESAADLPFDD